MANELTTQAGVKRPLYETVDVTSRVRAGSLAAHGLTDQAISEVLLLTLEQVRSCRECDEFKKKYAEVAEDQIQKQLDLAEGWDAVEESAVKQVLQTLEYNRDPKFALAAANVANKAERRKQTRDKAPALDASKVAGGAQIIVLKLNQNFINNQRDGDDAKLIDVTTFDKNNIPRKQVDLPSPKAVEEFLSPVKNTPKDKIMTEFQRQLEIAGVNFKINEDE